MSTELIIALIKSNIVLAVLLTNTILLIWLERKLVAGMQSRVGPDRAGPFGILQTVADAIKLLLVSFDSTMKANVSVGMPIDVCTINQSEFKAIKQIRIEKNDPYFEYISKSWGESLKKSIKELPPFDFK